jgi:phosphatidylglycerophosphatase A
MRLARLVATGCGIGCVPMAAGTAASAVAAAIGAAVLAWSAIALAVLGVAAFGAGTWAVRALRADDDPGWVVIDEYAGQWIALLGLARPTLPGVVLAFVLFRMLDIAKPGPVGWADRRHGAFGVMADDAIAGALTACVLWGLRLAWPGVLG